MGKPYSMDLRERVVAAVQSGGLSCNQAAKQFGVAISAAINWVKRLRETGSVKPGKVGGHKPRKISGAHRDWLLQRIRDGDFTLRGLVVELGERGLKVDYRSVWEFVHAEKLSFKKKRGGWRTRSSRRGTPADAMDEVSRSRRSFRLVFIDETWTKTNMAPLRGWAPCGERLMAKVPHGRWKTPTFLAALRHDRVDAPWLLDGPINGERFRIYVEKALAPTLREGDIVILGQSRYPSRQGGARAHPIRRRQALLPAKILPRPEPDRTGLRQAQASAAQSRRAHRRSHLLRGPRNPRRSPPKNAPTTSETQGINLKSSRSSA